MLISCQKGIGRLIFRITLLIIAVSQASIAEADLLKDSTERVAFKDHHIQVGYQWDTFEGALADWHQGTVSGKISKGSFLFLPKIDVANRFGQQATSYSLDIYHKFRNQDYMMVTGSYSSSDIFPGIKAGAEYFNPLGTWEASLGASYQQFNTGPKVSILTGGLSKYHGSFLSMAKGYLVFGNNQNEIQSISALVQERYYLNDLNYINLFASYGYDPNIFVIADNANITQDNTYQFAIGITGQFRILEHFDLIPLYSFTRFQFAITERRQHTLGMSLRYLIFSKS